MVQSLSEAGTSATYSETRRIPLGQLTPYPRNARRGDVHAIRESLRANGQYRSLIVRETPTALIVVAGNHTLQALIAHGPGICRHQAEALAALAAGEEATQCALCRDGWDETARCELIHCDEATARRINLVDNRTADLGGYDDEDLASILLQLGDDFHGTGYAEDDLTRILATLPTPPPADLDEDREPAAIGSPQGLAAIPSAATEPSRAPDDFTAPATQAPAAPVAFPEYGEDIDTQYCCPKCGYEWSGKPK